MKYSLHQAEQINNTALKCAVRDSKHKRIISTKLSITVFGHFLSQIQRRSGVEVVCWTTIKKVILVLIS